MLGAGPGVVEEEAGALPSLSRHQAPSRGQTAGSGRTPTPLLGGRPPEPAGSYCLQVGEVRTTGGVQQRNGEGSGPSKGVTNRHVTDPPRELLLDLR